MFSVLGTLLKVRCCIIKHNTIIIMKLTQLVNEQPGTSTPSNKLILPPIKGFFIKFWLADYMKSDFSQSIFHLPNLFAGRVAQLFIGTFYFLNFLEIAFG